MQVKFDGGFHGNDSVLICPLSKKNTIGHVLAASYLGHQIVEFLKSFLLSLFYKRGNGGSEKLSKSQSK